MFSSSLSRAHALMSCWFAISGPEQKSSTAITCQLTLLDLAWKTYRLRRNIRSVWHLSPATSFFSHPMACGSAEVHRLLLLVPLSRFHEEHFKLSVGHFYLPVIFTLANTRSLMSFSLSFLLVSLPPPSPMLSSLLVSPEPFVLTPRQVRLLASVCTNRLTQPLKSFPLCPRAQAWEGIWSVGFSKFFINLVPVPGLMLFLLCRCIAVVSAMAKAHTLLYLVKLNTSLLGFTSPSCCSILNWCFLEFWVLSQKSSEKVWLTLRWMDLTQTHCWCKYKQWIETEKYKNVELKKKRKENTFQLENVSTSPFF